MAFGRGWRRWVGAGALLLAFADSAFAVRIAGKNQKTLDVELVDVAADGRIVFQAPDGATTRISPETIAQPSPEALGAWLGNCAHAAYFGTGDWVGDLGKAYRLASKGDALGDAQSAAVLTLCLAKRNRDQAAFAAAMRAASRGSLWGMALVGVCYENAIGVVASRSTARQWYLKAYEKGSDGAALYLARLAFRERKQMEGADWLLRAVERFRESRDAEAILEAAQIAQDNGLTESAARFFAQAQRIRSGEPSRGPTPRSETPQTEGATGTAWFVTPREVMTCRRVVKGGARWSLHVPEEGREVALTLVAHDAQNDIALLRVQAGEAFACAAPLVFAKEDALSLAAPVFTIGFPRQGVQGNSAKYTEGSVSGMNGLNDALTHVQVSVPVQPGNSGGRSSMRRARWWGW